MKEMLKKKLQEKLNNKAGFTLLEILVVLTIMGFLIAMVAPRLAGISGSAVDTVCDSNQNRMTSMMSAYFERTNRFPSRMTNLVDEINAGEFQIPAVSDDIEENGPETLASEFMSRNHFRIHYLDQTEADELFEIGVVQVLNLNAYDAYDDITDAIKADYDDTALTGPNDVDLGTLTARSPAMDEAELDREIATEPLAVAMVGLGYNGTAWVVEDGEQDWGEPDWFGRIVLGFGPENGLITSGLVANAAHCPGGIQNDDNVTYNDYNLVLPRLAATAARLEAAAPINATGEVNAVAYDDAPTFPYDISATGNADNLKIRTFNVYEAQEGYQYASQCPEGHMYPASDEEFWGIDIGGTADTID